MVPFCRAADEHVEGAFLDYVTAALNAATQTVPLADIPAYGYVRGIWLKLSPNAAGSGGSAAGNEDAPWNALATVGVKDVNGAYIYGPVSGFDLFLADKLGGYGFATDPYQSPAFSAINATTGNFTILLYIPIELVNRTALGALPNQNAASTYKLELVVNSSTAIYSTPPATTLPTIRVQAWLAAWTMPLATDLQGAPQETTPPAMGTTQYWSKYPINNLAGAQTQRLVRVGNLIRNVVFVCRRASSTRANGETDWPTTTSILWDSRLLLQYDKDIWNEIMRQRTGYNGAKAAGTAGTLPSGVFFLDFDHELDGKVGAETGDGYLPTVQSTRLEFQGTFGNTDNVEVLTNDVAPRGDIYV